MKDSAWIKNLTSNYDFMVTKVKDNYQSKDYEVQLYRKRQGLKKIDLDVTSYIEEFQILFLSSKIQEEEPVKVARYLGITHTLCHLHHDYFPFVVQSNQKIFSLTLN